MMKNLFKSSILAFALCAPVMLMATKAAASDWPLVPGDFWDVTGVSVKDGGGLAYASFLATEWRKNQEFAKSKGWVKSYFILSNVYPRKGEPDLYLVSVTDRIATGAEGDKRSDEYLAWRQKSMAQMVKESGDRTEIREILSESLLQEMTFRK